MAEDNDRVIDREAESKAIAKRYADLFEVKEFPACKECGDKRESIIIVKDALERTPEREEISHLMFGLSNDFSMDFMYRAVSRAFDAIEESGLDGAREDISEYCQADSYTHDLTGWLAESVFHLQFLDEALGMGVKDGWHILAFAQGAAFEQAFNTVLDFVEKKLNEVEKEINNADTGEGG